MAHTLEQLHHRQNDTTLRNRVDGALMKEAAVGITADPQVNPGFAKIVLDGGPSGLAQAKRVLRYLVGKYPDKDAPTQTEIETAVAEVYPKL